MSADERASAAFSDPNLEPPLQQLAPLIRNRDMSRTTKITIMLKLADQVGKVIAPHTICGQGCSHCCKQAVSLADLEAKMIGEAIGRERKPVARRVAPQRVNEERRRLVETYNGVPCTFLGDDGACTIYEHRPLACRIHYSFEDTPDPCDPVANRGGQVASPDLRAFETACSHILAGTPYADIREFFPKE